METHGSVVKWDGDRLTIWDSTQGVYNVQMQVELIAPIAMEEGLRFAIREGGRTVGAGVVAKIHA